MRQKLKYDYSERILDVNSLCSQSLTQIDQVLFSVEAVQSDPRSLQMLDRLIQQHRDALGKIDTCKQHLLASLDSTN